MDDLRQTGLLKNLGAMDAYCWQHGGSITEDRRSYGYIAETENYRFCLRCTPFPGEYQGYLYCYDLCQQEMYRQEHPVVGRVTFASGEQQEFTDSKALLQAIREELPFRSTTGFRFETLTDDPEVKKAVDDILLDFAGEDNSRRTCNYGLTETGKQALRKAADPSIPHTYAWFVMADTNTPQEIIRQDLTLEEAIQIYQDSNTSEKRLGVIKDGIVLLETMKAADKDHRVFKLQFEAGEFDMVIYDQKENSCEIFEIKHSSKQVPFQYRHLVDEDKCQRTERRFGPIHGRYILYRGEDAQMENGVQYWNVENYLKALPTLDIVQVQEIGMQSIEPTL